MRVSRGWGEGGEGNVVFFFFQAEDGIRDYDVTGVQTCALPIWTSYHNIDSLEFEDFDHGTAMEQITGQDASTISIVLCWCEVGDAFWSATLI